MTLEDEFNKTPDGARGPNSTLIIHLLQLAGLVLPFGNFLGPIVFWLIKRSDEPQLDREAREILAFQGSFLIYGFGFMVVSFVPLIGWLLSLLLIPFFFAFATYWLFLVIRGSIQASNAETVIYPFKLKFLEDLVQKI